MNMLFGLGALILVAFFVLFFWLVTRHPDQRAILIATPHGKRGNLLIAPGIVAFVLAPMPVKAIAAAIFLITMIWTTCQQHRAMARAGADAAFLRRLAAVSAIGTVGMTVLAVAVLLDSVPKAGAGG
jgi:hypothetical protein